MCGIIATLSLNKNILKILIEGLKQLQNRGYDSAGISLIENNNLIIKKYASTDKLDSIKKLEQEFSDKNNSSYIGIAHTRWATHGGKTDFNSHPHLSYDNKICLVHNGIIENFDILKKDLIEKGIEFKSQTDTEVIVNLLAYNYNNLKNFTKALQKTLTMLEGTWGLVIINLDEPHKLYAVRHGSPLLVSIDEELVMISSEQSGFHGLTNNYIVLENNDICIVTKENDSINVDTNKKYQLKSTIKGNFDLSPDPYPYWTIKEINEQFESSLRAISMGGRLLDDNYVRLGGLEENKAVLKRIDNIILLGCGTSFNAGHASMNYFKKMCKFNSVSIYDGAEFDKYDIPKIGNSVIILISQSGETADLINCIEIAKENDIFMIGVVNVVDSMIAREVDCGCYLNAGREVGVASTKSFTNQVIILSMIAIWFSRIHKTNSSLRKQMINDLRKLPYDIKNTVNNLYKGLDRTKLDKAVEILNKKSMFVLGKGMGEAIANEGALKIKELSYIHSESYSSSSLKHGPFALLDSNLPVILLAPMDKNYNKIKNAYMEIISRNAPVILITENKNENVKNVINVEANKSYQQLLNVIPLQLFSYFLSINKGLDVDKPRNLAKCVTVL